MTHMAPEVMLQGRISKAADVYAFGMVSNRGATGNRTAAEAAGTCYQACRGAAWLVRPLDCSAVPVTCMHQL
jgi:hypothetical protein